MQKAIVTRPLMWYRGFPSETGNYLVELEDGEHCVTHYRAERRWVEADGDWDERTGWTCLTHSRARVVAWATIPKANGYSTAEVQNLKAAFVENDIPWPSE